MRRSGSASLQSRSSVLTQSARDLVPARFYPLFLTILFLSALATAYAVIRPINEMDWIRTVQQVRNLWRGVNPYCAPYCEFREFDADLVTNADYTSTQAYSPWVMFYLAPLAYITARGLIALSVAAWVVIVVDSGYPGALILFIHPAFLMLWAAANADFLINGVGLWLLLRGVQGGRRGITLMLLAIKPQILPLVIVLEGLRTLWERDWRAIGVIVAMLGISVVLFPAWLTDTVPTYLDIAAGEAVEDDGGLADYPFSVYGAWGLGAAMIASVAILLLMRRRLTEWRALAVLLGLVWTPYVNPYSYALLLILFRRTAAWRVGLFLALSLVTLPLLFAEFHQYERYGVLLFLLLTALLTTPEPDQTEEAIAARHGVRPLPGVGLVRRLARAR